MDIDALDRLTGTRSWYALPERYRNLSFVAFRPSGAGRLVLGFGQRTLADLPVHFEVRDGNTLALRFDVEEGVRAGTLVDVRAAYLPRETSFTLVEAEGTGACGEQRHWLLRLDASPFPAEIEFPEEPPLEYFGYGPE